MTIWYVRIACWIRRATNTQSDYVMLIAFPLQQLLHQLASMLRYMYIAGLVIYSLCNGCNSLLMAHKGPKHVGGNTL
jgi:hypothetical protein